MPIDKDRYWMSGLTFVLREQSAIAITLQAFELQLSRGQQFFTPLCPFFDGLLRWTPLFGQPTGLFKV